MPKPKRKTKQQPMSDDIRLRYELGGIFTATVGAVMLAAITVGIRGTAGELIQGALFMTFGIGAWVVPLLLIAIGGYVCFSLRIVRLSARVLPLTGLFLVLLATAHLISGDTRFEDAALMTHGGWVGAGLAVGLRTLLGVVGASIVLAGLALGCVCTLLTRPMADYASVACERAGGVASQMRSRMGDVSEVRRRRAVAAAAHRTELRKQKELHRTARDEEKRRRILEQSRMALPPPADPADADEEGEPDAPRFTLTPEEAAAIAGQERALLEEGRGGPPHGGPSVPDFLRRDGILPPRETDAAPVQAQLPLEDDLEERSCPVVLRPRRRGAWAPPPLDLLDGPTPTDVRRLERETTENIEILEDTLASFKIGAKVVSIERGPAITRYEVEPEKGIRVARIANLADDLARVLEAMDVRIEAPVPGKSVIGIEVPNKTRATVTLREILESEAMAKNPSLLAYALGKDIAGKVQVADLTRMPHLLVAGATNSGKSVCLNTLILSIVYRATPEQVKFIMIDPKRVELSLYEDIPHLIAPVVHDAREAAGLLRHAIVEMESRYRTLAEHGVRNITEYMDLRDETPDLEPMPYIVIVIDELADLMMQAAAEFEHSICRLAQLARAVGIHLVVATQRPSVNVVTGTIKANIPSRIAFAVSSQTDSRVILDQVGADRLIGQGDMLFSPIDASKPRRIQGAYISGREINRVVAHLKQCGDPDYSMDPLPVDTMKEPVIPGLPPGVDDEGVNDDLFSEIVRFVQSQKRISTSMLQRKFRIGYNRAARLIDLLEDKGVVGPADGSRPRRVLGGFGADIDLGDDVDELAG